jgi:hypothetical protein
MSKQKFGMRNSFLEGQGGETTPDTGKASAPPRFDRAPVSPETVREMEERTDRRFPHTNELRSPSSHHELLPEPPASIFPEKQEDDQGLIVPERRKKKKRVMANVFIKGPEDVCLRFERFVSDGQFAAKWDALEFLLEFYDQNTKKNT